MADDKAILLFSGTIFRTESLLPSFVLHNIDEFDHEIILPIKKQRLSVLYFCFLHSIKDK